MAKEVFQGIYTEFTEKMKTRGILLAEKNFGCFSSREWAPIVIKAAIVKLILGAVRVPIFLSFTMSKVGKAPCLKPLLLSNTLLLGLSISESGITIL
jgi:3-isopropylmalate dehydratase small subunit